MYLCMTLALNHLFFMSFNSIDDIMLTSDVSHESGTVDVSALNLSTVLRLLGYQ